MNWRRVQLAVAGVLSILVLFVGQQVYAAQSSSGNYSVDQVFFGSGSQLNACGTQYCARQSAGDTAVGNIAGTAFQAIAGSNTDRDPYIAFSTSGGSVDLGVLSIAGTATTSASFAIKTYLASGYVVRLAADPPSAAGHAFTNLTSPTAAAAPGTAEQFGINLVANTTGCGAPANYGADPVQVPDSSFSFGTVASGYNTCGLFKYVNGDVIASSSKSSGETDYTMSFIYNITNVTADGQYVYQGDLVATSTY